MTTTKLRPSSATIRLGFWPLRFSSSAVTASIIGKVSISHYFCFRSEEGKEGRRRDGVLRFSSLERRLSAAEDGVLSIRSFKADRSAAEAEILRVSSFVRKGIEV